MFKSADPNVDLENLEDGYTVRAFVTGDGELIEKVNW